MTRNDHHFILAVDDTGNSAPLLTPSLEPGNPGNHDPVGLGAFMIREDQVDSFENDLYALRYRLGRELGLSVVPPIHCRLMFGKRLRPLAKAKVPNPYYVDDAKEIERRFPVIVEHLRQCAGLVARYTRRPRTAMAFTTLSSRRELIESAYQAYSVPEAEELMALKRMNRRVFDAYFRELTHPLLPPITDAWILLNEQVRDAGGASAHVRFDTFAGTEQLASDKAYEILRDVGQLEHLRPNALCLDSHEDALIQAADLGVYMAQRRKGGDEVAAYILRHKSGGLTAATLKVLADRADRRAPRRNMLMHFAVTRAAAEAVDAEFVNHYFKTSREMADAIASTTAGTSYISLFKDSVNDETLVAGLKPGQRLD